MLVYEGGIPGLVFGCMMSWTKQNRLHAFLMQPRLSVPFACSFLTVIQTCEPDQGLAGMVLALRCSPLMWCANLLEII